MISKFRFYHDFVFVFRMQKVLNGPESQVRFLFFILFRPTSRLVLFLAAACRVPVHHLLIFLISIIRYIIPDWYVWWSFYTFFLLTNLSYTYILSIVLTTFTWNLFHHCCGLADRTGTISYAVPVRPTENNSDSAPDGQKKIEKGHISENTVIGVF